MSDRHVFEKRVYDCEIRILKSIGFNLDLSPILIKSGKIEGSLQQICEKLKISEKKYKCARGILTEESLTEQE